MSSRQDEKQKRRAEREAIEAAEARTKARKERLQLGMGALVAIAAVVVAVVVFSGSGGGDSGADPTTTEAANGIVLPPVKTTNLQDAAKLASCTLADPPNEGRDHVSGEVVYKNSNPPASGNHNPTPAEDGIYAPGNSPAKENFVHSLEHGRIEIQYKPGTDTRTRQTLEKIASEPLDFGRDGYKTLTFENNTQMTPAIAVTAWTHVMSCEKLTAGTADAIRAFRKAYTDKGPEFIP